MGRRDVYTATVSFDYDDCYPKNRLGLKITAAMNKTITGEYTLSKSVNDLFSTLANELTSTVTNNARYFSTACIKYSVSTFFQPVKETRSNKPIVIETLLKLLSDKLTRLGPCDKAFKIDHETYQTLKNFTPLEKTQLKEILAKADHKTWKLKIHPDNIANHATLTQPQKTLVPTH